MATLERALQIAVQAHAGQKDKSHEAYIFHPLRVMMRCFSEEAKMVALLHDVVEDTAVTMQDVASEGFSETVLSALKLVTHGPGVSYEDYIQAIAANRIATEVKLADLEDNSDLKRMQKIDDRTVARLKKYLAAHRLLTAKRAEYENRP